MTTRSESATGRSVHDDPYATYREPLTRAAELALEYLEGLPERFVGPQPDLSPESLRAALGQHLPDEGEAPETVIEALAAAVEPGLTAMSGPRYFGFVIGGTLPAALAADWLTSAWDQNAAMHVPTPAAAAVEAAAAAWLVELFGLPSETTVGFTTSATTANLTALAAARHEVLHKAGWDVEANGLYGAPEIAVFTGDEAHPSVSVALRLLGLGAERVARIPTDANGAMRPDALAAAVAGSTGPVIVIAQAGNVNSGAFDPLVEIATAVRQLPNAWLHVDGAFGLWAAASPRLRGLVDGIELADSIATDAHKWLNTPYDSGLAFVRHERPHRAAMSMSAAYLPASPTERDPSDYVPELSRRARGFPVYASLRSLGRNGVAALVERDWALASLMAERLAADPRARILNDVVLNQVVVRFADDDATTREVIGRVQRDGTAWAGPTVWRGRAAMRISVSGWATSEDDALRSVDAILRCLHETAESGR